MKKGYPKILIALIISLTMVTFISCDNTPNVVQPNPISISTNFFTIYNNNWSKATDNSGQWDFGHWYYRLRMPSITVDVINNGAVLVYYKNNYNNWVMMPYSTTLYNSKSQLFTEEIWSGYALGSVDIDYVYSDPLNPTPPNQIEIKIVVMRY